MLPLHLLLLAAAAHNPLGPGPHPWVLTPPSAVGLNYDALAAAATAVGCIGTQLCLTVVKNGALVLDHSYSGAFMDAPGGADPATRGGGRPLEAMSAAKTITAAVTGAASAAGLFDIDTPLSSYGVRPAAVANWNRTGTDFYPQVTARHLLAQASGLGVYPPGTAMTYDSDEFVEHLSYLINVTAGRREGNMTANEWATT